MNFKAGDTIRMKDDCGGCKKGQIYELHWGSSNGVGIDRLWAWSRSGYSSDCPCEHRWELVCSPITWDNIGVGDQVKHPGNSRFNTVLGVLDDLLFISYAGVKDRGEEHVLKSYFISEGYTIIQPEPPKEDVIEMTLEEVAKMMGLPVTQIRIKE